MTKAQWISNRTSEILAEWLDQEGWEIQLLAAREKAIHECSRRIFTPDRLVDVLFIPKAVVNGCPMVEDL